MTKNNRTERQVGKLSPSIQFTLKDGVSYSFPYSTIIKVDYFPSTEIRVFFPMWIVSIYGRDLALMYREISENRLIEVIENDSSLVEDSGAFVSKIDIAESGSF